MNSALASEYNKLLHEYKGGDEAEKNAANNVKLRKATLDDVKQIQHIENTCFKSDKPNMLNFILPIITPHKELL